MHYQRALHLAAALILIVAWGGAGAAAAPGDGAETAPASTPVPESRNSSLWDHLEAQQQATGDFEQLLYSEGGELLVQSRGEYRLLRPGFFRWDIESPDSQLIVVSGDELWHYDRDLASATRRNARSPGSFSALELLAGDGADLRQRFAVTELGDDRYRLVPVYAGAGFSSVELQWRERALVAMVIRDRGGQEIQLSLTPDPNAAPLTADDFSFSVPEGVEVFDAFES